MSDERRRGQEGKRLGPSDPRHLGASLDAVARDLGAPTATTLAKLFGKWPEIVGEAVAAHSWPVAVERGTLIIGVDDPGWATQLSFLERSLVTRLAAVVGPGEIERVRVRIRPR